VVRARLLLLSGLLACEGLTLSPPEPHPSQAPVVAAPPIAGAELVKSGEALLLAREDAVWRVALPLGSSPPERHAMPGRVGELALVGGEVLATVAEPGLLLRLAADDLRELGRTTVPKGALGLAASGDGAVVLVASSGKLTAVRGREVAWSLDVPADARRVALDGDGAYVAHASGLTRVDGLGGEPRARPFGASEALEPRFAARGDELFLGYSVAADQALATARVDRLDAQGVHTGATAALPLRAMAARGHRLFVADDRDLVELDGKLEVVATRPTAVAGEACGDPRGVVLGDDSAFVACGDGAIHALPLAGGESKRVTLTPAPASPCTAADAPPNANEHMMRFGSAEEIHGWIRRYHCAHPDVTELSVIGKTHLGRPLYALTIGKRPYAGKPTLLLNGAHHGSELMSSTFALDAIDRILKDPSSRWVSELVFIVVPLVNPDGNYARLEGGLMGRKNGRDNDGDGKLGGADGVDLNRNYPFQWNHLGESQQSSSEIHSRYYRGPEGGSEPEVRAMMRLAEIERFAASISFHTGTLAVLAPYTMPHLVDPVPNEALTVADDVARSILGHPEGGVPVRRNLYPVDGTDQDWLRYHHGTLALLVEAVRKWQVDVAKRTVIVNAIRSSWMTLADRYLDGPSLGGRVLDALGRPLEAEVSLAEVERPQKERWTSRCKDGRFDRYLAKAGTYTLRVALDGGAVLEEKVVVDKHVERDIYLPLLVTEAARCPAIGSEGATPAKVILLTRPADAQ
jgi:hypothetical protein